MPRQRDLDIKDFIEQVGVLFDARAKTWEINFKRHVDEAIKASEQRIRKDMATKDDIKDMVRQSDIKDMVRQSDIKDMATKQDIHRLEAKIDKTQDLQRLVDELRKRLDRVEAELATLRSKN